MIIRGSLINSTNSSETKIFGGYKITIRYKLPSSENTTPLNKEITYILKANENIFNLELPDSDVNFLNLETPLQIVLVDNRNNEAYNREITLKALTKLRNTLTLSITPQINVDNPPFETIQKFETRVLLFNEINSADKSIFEGYRLTFTYTISTPLSSTTTKKELTHVFSANENIFNLKVPSDHVSTIVEAEGFQFFLTDKNNTEKYNQIFTLVQLKKYKFTVKIPVTPDEAVGDNPVNPVLVSTLLKGHLINSKVAGKNDVFSGYQLSVYYQEEVVNKDGSDLIVILYPPNIFVSEELVEFISEPRIIIIFLFK